jgi:hypothetical protein
MWPVKHAMQAGGQACESGLSSNVPIFAVGCRDTASMASSRSAHSSTLKPAICSFVSAN